MQRISNAHRLDATVEKVVKVEMTSWHKWIAYGFRIPRIQISVYMHTCVLLLVH